MDIKASTYQMKKGQSVITLIFKDSGDTYLFGSLSAIYGLFSSEQLGITYSSLRNAVSKYIKENKVNEDGNDAQLIYNTKNSKITLHRAPLLLADKNA